MKMKIIFSKEELEELMKNNGEILIPLDTLNIGSQKNENKKDINYLAEIERMAREDYLRKFSKEKKEECNIFTKLLSSANENTEELNNKIIALVFETSYEDLPVLHYSKDKYSSVSLKFAAITGSFISNKKDYYNSDDEIKKILNEFADKCIKVMGYHKSTLKGTELNPAPYYLQEIFTRHIGIETFLGKKVNNKYCFGRFDPWKLAEGKFFIQAKYVTEITENFVKERYYNIPDYYRDKSCMFDDSFENIEIYRKDVK